MTQTSYFWSSDSTISFKSFGNGIKESLQNDSFGNLSRIYLLVLKALNSVFLCILLNKNYCLEAKLNLNEIHALCHAGKQ